jgi:hypothetical protein
MFTNEEKDPEYVCDLKNTHAEFVGTVLPITQEEWSRLPDFVPVLYDLVKEEKLSIAPWAVAVKEEEHILSYVIQSHYLCPDDLGLRSILLESSPTNIRYALLRRVCRFSPIIKTITHH